MFVLAEGSAKIYVILFRKEKSETQFSFTQAHLNIQVLCLNN